MPSPNPETADIGLIGLAVMGQNLVLNMTDHDVSVAVYNRTESVTREFVEGRAADVPVIPAVSLEDLVDTLARPRKIMLMVKAGQVVDMVLDELVPLLDEGDIVLDGGNSHYPDTRRRAEALNARGIRFLGVGVSGGEEGARNGPSIMPGGDRDAYEQVAPILRAIAAKAPDGEPCVDWLGEDGAGHFVKMVHNGIEYGDMQLIAEAYHLMREGLGMTPEAMQRVFSTWNDGVLDSYLIEITADILNTHDEDGALVLDTVLDTAGQKGTGRWTAIDALEQGVPLTLIDEAVAARSLSAAKEERVRASSVLHGTEHEHDGDDEAFLNDLHDALYASKIVGYAQGIALMREASRTHEWTLDPGKAAALWRAGCIIRSRFLNDITQAFRSDQGLDNLLLAPFFTDAVHQAQEGWRRTVARAVTFGVPVPAMSAALTFFDGYRTANGPANLIQAQRDYFGAHTYERVDRPRGQRFHFDWIGSGGGVTSGGYDA
ncbi:MAG: decarboxylating NADP(+)-dependent phosphogluconate dehydrogenase [Trueperaceae bacterium]|nr:decarboxylating NADP(+)-dependent phosphogluconate dehydrogenase [Trueperaceae bacterium]